MKSPAPWALVAVALGAACAQTGTALPESFTVGAFTMSVVPASARLSVLGPGGVPLLGGLDSSSDVGKPQSANDDAPPMTGFAVRDLSTTYKMMYGSFAIADDTTQPWQVVERAAVASGNRVDLLDGGGARVASVTFTRGDEDAHLVASITAGAGAPPASTDPAAPRRRISWGFSCDADDHFVGFGAQTWGVDARGETIPIWVQEEGIGKDLKTDDPTGVWYVVGRRHSAYMPLPEFLARRGYVAVAETNALSTFALCSERQDVARMELELPVTVHLFYGPSPHDALSRATTHFGRPRVPPAFAFAPWNDAIFGSANVRRVATKLRTAGAPSSVIWTEDWRGGDWNGDNYTLKEEWDVDRSLYPDFESVAADLHAAGFKWLVYFNSFVQQDSAAWPETAPQGYLVRQTDGTPYTFTDAKFRPASMVDLTNTDAVAWAVGKMKAAIALGADGWMGDYGEWLPTDAVLAEGRGIDFHDEYPVLWQKAQRRALDETTAADGVERLSFVRSGWLGTAPLADVFWAGDQRTDFEPDDGMPTILPIGIGVGLAGVSTFGSDIAGYQSATNPTSSKELFFRWTELGAWSPVMRTHHGTEPKLEWSWESDAPTLTSRRTSACAYAYWATALGADDARARAASARHGCLDLAPARRRVPCGRGVVVGGRRGDGGSGAARRPGADDGRHFTQRVSAAGQLVPMVGRSGHRRRRDGDRAGAVGGDSGVRARRDHRARVPRWRSNARPRTVERGRRIERGRRPHRLRLRGGRWHHVHRTTGRGGADLRDAAGGQQRIIPRVERRALARMRRGPRRTVRTGDPEHGHRPRHRKRHPRDERDEADRIRWREGPPDHLDHPAALSVPATCWPS